MHRHYNIPDMKKVLYSMFLAMAAMLFVSCSQKAEEPAVDPEEATILANDVTVEEGASAYVRAATNSTAPIQFVADNSGVYTVDAEGKVTGVKAGSGMLTLKVDAVEGKFTSAEKTISVTVTAVPPVDDGKPKPGNYTFTASAIKGKWVAGDQIYIQGGYGPAAQVITLEAAQLSADGKTATVELGGDLFKYFASPDNLYAVWPASAVKKDDGLTGQVIEYDVFDILLTQAYLKDGNFAFKDMSSYLSFTVSGDYDHFMIAGAQRPGLRFTSYKTEYSSVKVTPAKPKDDGYPFREEALSDGSATIWFPGGITLTGGFTLYFASGENWVASYSYSEDAKIKAGEKLELGDITAQLTPYSGGKPHMPEVSGYTKYSVAFNELSGLYMSVDQDFLWAVDDNGSLGKISFTGEVLYKKSYGGEWEDITIDPATGDLLIGNEEPVSIYRIAAPEYTQRTKLFNVPGTSGFGNAGLEGLTYYKDGMIMAGMQTGSWLFCCDLATGEVVWKKELRKIFPSITEIGGLCYDPLTDWLWIVDSESHKFFALTGDATQILGAYQLKTKSNEEAIYVDHIHGCVWIGDDYGSTSYLYKYSLSGLDDFIIEK